MAILHPFVAGLQVWSAEPFGKGNFREASPKRRMAGLAGKLPMLVPVPAIQLEELIHELSSDNVGENPAATLWKGCFAAKNGSRQKKYIFEAGLQTG